MANLNFQQPPRSIASQGLSRGGFSSSSLSGHVTPTSGMFPGSGGGTSGGGTSFTPQQLSPNRGLSAAMTNRSLFGQRAFPERRQIPGLGSVIQDWSSSSMAANFGMAAAAAASRSYGSQGLANFHSVFSGSSGGGTGDSSTPPLLDLSEFPSLTNRGGQGDSVPQPSTLPAGKQPYVGMVKQPTAESSEFTMSSEDFPALPGTGAEGSGGGTGGGTSVSGASGTNSTAGTSTGTAEKVGSSSESTTSSQDTMQPTSSRIPQTQETSKQPVKRGIQTSPDGKVTNIPNSMVKDQFGMVGLLTFIRAAETDPNLVSLALGQDLTALGLNLNSVDNLYPTFGGPWAEMPCRAQDIDYNVPPEYIINHSIREKLAQLKLARYKEDLLFFMYYTNAGDMLQLVAAAELYSREWRFHMEEKVWITQAPGLGVTEKTSTYERGTYYYFDAVNWRKVIKEFYLDYSKLENQPTIPPSAYHAV
ncbi:CCR4-NOT transcription complex subunit 2-like isoform X2 [Cimex lectularius]|uniref:NOT2/NOT3/NOT5 C-terminal domain-containing protein n=1 Tax=Cimex lectularius TaxID=79782 RepID=A0A8I6RPF2_CIMLE|nr:CCR4-NOT transcription complex subunit 2-like isoform X2 [Cimex lectularius]XP_014249047.1 CCR4-NOT transcription complex subunit 2-like isoform X2 [Cimex lectularius]